MCYSVVGFYFCCIFFSRCVTTNFHRIKSKHTEKEIDNNNNEVGIIEKKNTKFRQTIYAFYLEFVITILLVVEKKTPWTSFKESEKNNNNGKQIDEKCVHVYPI